MNINVEVQVSLYNFNCIDIFVYIQAHAAIGSMFKIRASKLCELSIAFHADARSH